VTRKYRVIQYATGGAGKHAVAGIVGHPQLDLVGLLVHSKEKVGLDAGVISGITPLGVKATDDVEQILAMQADCVSYMALWPDVDLICRFLESGKNVVTTSGLLYPKFFGPALVQRLEKACAKGATSVHGTGVNPGFSGEVLPLTMSVLSRRIDQIFVALRRPVLRNEFRIVNNSAQRSKNQQALARKYFHVFGDPRKDPRVVHGVQRFLFVQQSEMRLRAVIDIARRFGAHLELGDHPRRHGVHLRAGAETNLAVETKFFIERGFQQRQSLLPAESLRTGNKSKFRFFLRPGNQ